MHLVCVSQFFRQFWLVVRHKPGKKYIIFDILSGFPSTNIDLFIDGFASYLELNALFTYFTTLAKISPNLPKRL